MEGAQNIILYQQKSAHSEFIPFSCDVQHCDWRRKQTTKPMWCFNSSNKVQ